MLTSRNYFLNVLKKIPNANITQQCTNKLFFLVLKVRGGERGGGGVVKWKLRIENCVFATSNSQLSIVNYGF